MNDFLFKGAMFQVACSNHHPFVSSSECPSGVPYHLEHGGNQSEINALMSPPAPVLPEKPRLLYAEPLAHARHLESQRCLVSGKVGQALVCSESDSAVFDPILAIHP